MVLFLKRFPWFREDFVIKISSLAFLKRFQRVRKDFTAFDSIDSIRGFSRVKNNSGQFNR